MLRVRFLSSEKQREGSDIRCLCRMSLTMKTLWVKVECLPGCNDPDRTAGLCKVTLSEEMQVGHAMGAALDVFHRQRTISVVDDCEIRALDPVSR